MKIFKWIGFGAFFFLYGLTYFAWADQEIFTGEKIHYAIKKLGMKAGKASLVFQGPVEVDQRLFKKSFEKFKERPDKSWSLVDCIGMVVAEEYGIQEIFSRDHDFNQAGFATLLKGPK